ncbi:ABC transporter ATP-binding protein [Halanaerobium sp. ST460_2HS_T2]|uniref:ABC transporter ATP-binding protein n=1 Tax=Halanaerobium sp. ST460_2HS_T2 TaxID=2183914 RepID=UPI000DF35FB8|nr:ABC transporter ATP-binding protein [Halanaerobium sp. ST460_2HS_T2]RCW52372.1 nucleoside ABC transporter ATP-binding protein [Halanaerobium sp. ST460_2HS_T2]
MTLAIEMKNITKQFPGVKANDKVSFNVEKGEIHSLLGENGAGKTTLMNVLFGLYKAEKGEIFLKGEKIAIENPKQALKKGLGMVHQHFMLINRMTVLENIILGMGNELSLNKKEHRKRINKLAGKYDFAINIDEKIENLSVGMKQRVEILKTLYRGAEIIIFDEPTAVLTPGEVEELYNILNMLRDQGKTVIFITHKLNETMEIADRITVLRNGKKVSTIRKEDTNTNKLAQLMVGREVEFEVEIKEKKPGNEILKVKNLELLLGKNESIDLSIQQGEIVGIAGVEGNGQLELEEMIMGLRKVKKGHIYLNNKEITEMRTKDRKKMKIAYIPSDRHNRAIFKNFTIEENILLGYHYKLPFCKNHILQKDNLKKHSQKIISDYNIKTPDSGQLIKNLSGGNQQKVVLGREVSQQPEFILAAQPTRGLDIGAIEYIHNLLLELREDNKGILLISADLNEVIKLSDRIAVLYEGKFMGLKDKKDFSRKEIGMLMAGEMIDSEA